MLDSLAAEVSRGPLGNDEGALPVFAPVEHHQDRAARDISAQSAALLRVSFGKQEKTHRSRAEAAHRSRRRTSEIAAAPLACTDRKLSRFPSAGGEAVVRSAIKNSDQWFVRSEKFRPSTAPLLHWYAMASSRLERARPQFQRLTMNERASRNCSVH